MSVSVAVALILAGSAPVEVVRCVVRFVVIPVKAKHFSRARADKCFRDKVMNLAQFALDLARKVSTVKPDQAQHFATVQVVNTPKAAYQVIRFMPMDWAP